MTMTRRLLCSLTILVLVLLVAQGRPLMAQSTGGDGSTRDSRGPSQEWRRELAPANSRVTSSQVSKSDQYPAVRGMVKIKGYEFSSIDYPGTYASQVYDSNGKTAVGCTVFGANVFTFQGSSYVPLNVPGARQNCGLGINTSGEIVGWYEDSSNDVHGFLYDGSRYTTIDYPGSGFTEAWDISDAGLIVGYYADSSSFDHGFLYDNGTFTGINFPGADNTFAYAINSGGDIVGNYNLAGIQHGFILSKGIYSAVDFPEAYGTYAFGINNAGSIAGYFVKLDSSGIVVPHGFTYSGGVLIQVDVPGAIETFIYRINNKDNVVGIIVDALGEYHGIIGK